MSDDTVPSADVMALADQFDAYAPTGRRAGGHPMTADDLTRLRGVAEAATLYPNRPENGWMIDPDDDTIILAPKQSNGWDGIAICREVIRIEDARFIATFDPPTVAALIDRVERAERERDEACAELDRVRQSNGPVYHDEVCAYFVISRETTMASDEFSEWFIAADKRNWTCSERVARAAFAAGRASDSSAAARTDQRQLQEGIRDAARIVKGQTNE